MKTFFLFLLTAALLTGCASAPTNSTVAPRHRGWLMGKLTTSDGHVLDFLIQKRMVLQGSASGGVYATNTVTGQSFEGQYSGIMQGGFSQSWATATVSGSGGSATANAQGWGQWQSAVANTQAFLSDGKGTVINLRMEIRAGWVPHGFGGGRDNHGTEYQVQF